MAKLNWRDNPEEFFDEVIAPKFPEEEREDVRQVYYKKIGYTPQDESPELPELPEEPPEQTQLERDLRGFSRGVLSAIPITKPLASLIDPAEEGMTIQEYQQTKADLAKAKETTNPRTLKDAITGLERPMVDPIDVIGFGGIFGLKSGLKAGLKGMELAKNIGTEMIDEITFGAQHIAKAAVKGAAKGARKGAKKIFKKSPDYIDELVKQIDDPDALKAAKHLKENDEALEKAKQIDWEKFFDKLGIMVIDDAYGVKRALQKYSKEIGKKIKAGEGTKEEIEMLAEMQKSAENSIQKRILMHGSSAQAAQMMHKIDKIIFKDLTQKEISTLGKMRNALRSAEVGKRVKVKGKPKEYNALIDKFKTQQPEVYDKLKIKNEKLQVVFNHQLEQLLDSGILSMEKYNKIIAKGENYNPRKIIEYIDAPVGGGVYKGTGKHSNLQFIKGYEESIVNDPRFLVQDYVARTQSIIARNDSAKALYDFALKNPDQSIARISKGKAGKKEGTVKVFVGGEEKTLIMPKDLAEQWNGLDPILSHQQAKWISWLTGNKVLKAFATGINPAFAVRNLARDAAYVIMSPEYSTVLPKAAGQLIKDYAGVFKDALKKKGAYLDYIKEGGGLETLTEQGKLFDKHFQKTQNVLGWLGEFTERWTRLAHRARAIKNGKSSVEATFIARDALDFGQGGTVAKALNSAIPYFNAGIQGTRGMAKLFAKDKKKFLYKFAQLGSTASTVYLVNTSLYKDDYDKISDRVKADNWIIMIPFTHIDKNGDEQRRYLTIPKDQTQRPLTAMFEMAMAKFMGHETDGKQVSLAADSFLSMLPAGEAGMTPLARAVLGYSQNINWYRDEPIWKGEELPASMEYKWYTPEIYKKIAGSEETKEQLRQRKDVENIEGQISPERLRYAVSQFVTNNNMISNFFGIGLNAILSDMDKEERAHISDQILRTMGMGMLRSTRNDEKLLEKNVKIKLQAAGSREQMRRDQDDIYRYMKKEGIEENEDLMINWIESQPPLKREYLANRYENMRKLETLDKKNYKWWNDLMSATTSEAKAKMFYEKYKNETPEKQKEMIAKADRLRGFGESFYAELERIKGE